MAWIEYPLRVITEWLAENSQAAHWFTTVMRFIFPVLALLILVRAIRSLCRIPHTPETWGQLGLPNGDLIPLTHWENIIGRSRSSDITLNYPNISRQHAALIREENRRWTVYDLDSKGGVRVNDKPVCGSAAVKEGDTISLAGVPVVLLPMTQEEEQRLDHLRQKERPVPMWPSFVGLTLFQILTCFQLIISYGLDTPTAIPAVFLALLLTMWVYVIVLRLTHCIGFETETIAFFLCTLSLAVTASSAPGSLRKQYLAILIGLCVFVALGIILKEFGGSRFLRWFMGGACLCLLGATVLFGTVRGGAANWIILGSLSIQPSELAKICYIIAGSATLDRLFRKRNLWLFIILTGICIVFLGLISDFGTAAVYFVTFVVIAFLRSGDWTTLALICGGAVFGGGLIVMFRPYIFNRFSVWGHAWQHASDAGFQQTRTMSAAASGGLVGVGAGNGWLHRIAAADTDLVFGMICEEWGLLIALLAVAGIVTLAVFSIRACRVGRSSFYVIAACAAGSLLVFQTALNVLGSVDILPLTGVTFPFVSNGGTAMISAWGLLAFLKASDTRDGASFAIRQQAKRAPRSAGHSAASSGREKNRSVLTFPRKGNHHEKN